VPSSGDRYSAPHLAKNAANFTALTPLAFLPRAAAVYPDKLAVIDGAARFTYRELYTRCRRLADALRRRGIGPGDTVAVMAPNIPALLEAHFGVPMAGAVLNALNYRLDARSIAFILAHGEAKLLIADREFAPIVSAALEEFDGPMPLVEIGDAVGIPALGGTEYEAFLAEGDPAAAWVMPRDEWDAIALNYTSGTTGNPKGVVYHHRGAFLNAIGNAVTFGSIAMRSISGPCRCFIATAGPTLGRSPPSPEPMSACGGSIRRRSSRRSPSTGLPICAARRSC
jgi:3-(methylthio)propionyl---CoA ligase